MSIQACMPTSCKNQHSVKSAAKSPSFLRHGSSSRQNAVNRRSAVERLEESKANYVKSESVLDSKQEFKNSSHLHVRTGPQLDLTLKPPRKQSLDLSCAPTNIAIDLNVLGPKSCLQQRNPLPHRSPPPTRLRTKSHSESRDVSIRRNLSFASRGSHPRIGTLVDIESQLKRLITSGSKENIITTTSESFYCNATNTSEAQIVPKIYKPPELPKVRRGYSDPTHKGGWNDTVDSAEPKKYPLAHKSLPDLSPPFSIQAKSFHSDNSDDSIFQNCVPVLANRTAVQCLAQPRTQSPVNLTDGVQEPRRFSNGTGTLHLTPYCPQSSNQYQRRPVIRSKSDVSHRYTKKNSEYNMKRNNHYTNAEIERFFDTMGLDTTVWHHITSPSSISSPPCFFDSVSSVDSNDRSSTYSEESVPAPPKEGLRNFDLKGHGPLETSIVEKNARVIKWLYNCRKAAKES